MNTAVNHPFDKLELREYSWCTSYFSELLQGEIELIVENENSPEKWQRELFDEFRKNEIQFRRLLVDAIFDYYQTVAPEYRERWSDESQAVLPSIRNSDEVMKLVRPTGLLIGDLLPENKEIGLLFECSWEEEHGLGVKVENGNIKEVGYQDICI